MDFAQMVPIGQRSILLREIYNGYEARWPQRKTRFCESVRRVLGESRIPAMLLDRYRKRDSARYELTTTRLMEYIRGRNRRLKDDLFWACMYVALLQSDPSARKQIRDRIRELALNLEDRLAEVKRFLEQEQPRETIDRDIFTIPEENLAEVLDTALLEGLPDQQIAEFLAKRFESTPPRLNEEERSQIRKRIHLRMNKHFKNKVGQSEVIKQSVQSFIERKIRPTHSDLVRCAKNALKKTRKNRKSSASKILETFAASVRARVKARSIRFIDRAIDETLHMTGLVAS